MRTLSSIVIVLALGVLPSAQVHAPAIQSRYFLNSVKVSDDVRVTVFEQLAVPGEHPEQPAFFVVALEGQSRRDDDKTPNPKPLAGMTLHVWLLRVDGTTLAQREPPANIHIGSAGYDTDIMSFSFEDAPPKDVVGVVVSVNGKLFTHEIKATE